MKIDFPLPKQYPQLIALWQEAFGDSEDFIEGFFYTGFSPSRCRCVTVNGKVAAALYWLDVQFAGQRFAYIYAVATAENMRSKGICKALMEDTHAHLKLRGYDGALLVPQEPGLREMYGKMGYADCTTVSSFTCEAGAQPAVLRRIDRDEYAALRRKYLPSGSVIQEDENISYLEMMAFFYAGENFLLAARKQGQTLHCREFLGSWDAAPGVLAALECTSGTFRTPGEDTPFAMFLPLTKNAAAPTYFGLAFD